MMTRPSFMDYVDLDNEEDGWKLIDGAPESAKREFDEYMRQREEDEERGIVA